MALVKFFPVGDGTFAVEIDGQRVPDVTGFRFQAELGQPSSASVDLIAGDGSTVESEAATTPSKRAPLLNPVKR